MAIEIDEVSAQEELTYARRDLALLRHELDEVKIQNAKLHQALLEVGQQKRELRNTLRSIKEAYEASKVGDPANTDMQYDNLRHVAAAVQSLLGRVS